MGFDLMILMFFTELGKGREERTGLYTIFIQQVDKDPETIRISIGFIAPRSLVFQLIFLRDEIEDCDALYLLWNEIKVAFGVLGIVA